MNIEKFKSLIALIQAPSKENIEELKRILSTLTPDDNINAIHAKYSLQEYAMEQYVKNFSDKSTRDNLYKIIELLFQHGANPDIKNDKGTPLFHLFITQQIANPDNKAYNDQYNAGLELIRLFNSYKADFNIKDDAGYNPINAAVRARNYNFLGELYGYGSGPNIPCKPSKGLSGSPETPLDTFISQGGADTSRGILTYKLLESMDCISCADLIGVEVDAPKTIPSTTSWTHITTLSSTRKGLLRTKKMEDPANDEGDFLAHCFVKRNDLTFLALYCNNLDLTKKNRTGQTIIDLARNNNQLPDLFSIKNRKIRSAIQSQFPHAVVREALAEVELQIKKEASESKEMSSSSTPKPLSVTTSEPEGSIEEPKPPKSAPGLFGSPEEKKKAMDPNIILNTRIPHIRAACINSKETVFKEHINLLITELGGKDGLTSLFGDQDFLTLLRGKLNLCMPTHKKRLETYLEPFRSEFSKPSSKP
jgi:hypothetical protein